ncbi:MAG: sigma-70 family RNA polymerase sigma factor [Lachnospira sp.]|nr:sigma-70 family RNA polymerase sigma factor [Lachnospira sp.]
MKLTNELREAIENYKNGNEDAFSTIYEESKGYIYVCIANTLNSDYKNEDVIQDIMQDAYLDISKNLIKLDNTEDFLSWAATIAKRRTYDYLKKQGKYVLLGEDESFDNLTDNNMLPEEVVLSKEKQEKVREVVNTELTEDEKNCVVGFYYNDMKQKDIAKELDMPENTVKSNIFRAKSKMKKALSGVFVVALAACLLIVALNTNAVKEALRKIGYNKEEAQTKVMDEPSEQASEVEEPSVVEEFGTEIIPEGCEYYSAKTYKTYRAGEKFLKTPSDGDRFWTTDYIYIRTGGIWTLKVKDTNKTEYEAIMSPIAGEPLLSIKEVFKNCEYLIKTPTIPNTVTDMSYTFKGCSSLVEVPTIPDTVTNMECTFSGCSSLVEAPVIPESVIDMSYTFYGCISLVEAPIIPDTVTSMYYTFSGCSSLVEAPVIPESVTNMECTFDGCSSLVEAPVIPESVIDMYYTFSGCSSLVEAPVIPEKVTNMRCTFWGCTSLVEAPVIPDTVTNMYYTFSGCSSLVEAPIIPESVTDMTYTFAGCTSLTGTVIINANPDYYINCFEYIFLEKQNITLSGASNKLAELKATADSEEKRMVRMFQIYRIDGIVCDYDKYDNDYGEIGQYI